MFADTGYNPLLIVDFRVIAWKIYPLSETVAGMLRLPQHKELAALEAMNTADQKVYLETLGLPYTTSGKTVWERKEIFQQWVKASWALAIQRGPDMLPRTNFTTVVVDDNGSVTPYWRTTKLLKYFAEERPEEAHLFGYKAGRAAKPDRWGSVAQLGLEYVTNPKSGIAYFSEPGYEADDWAGALVAYKRLLQRPTVETPRGQESIRDREVFLYTIDTDWLQLAGEGVYWCNTGPWHPRLRGETQAIAYITKKSKKRTHKLLPGGKISNAHQIVDIKMQEGDSSDNLPPGSPRWAIDLINSHPDHELRKHSRFKEVIPAISANANSINHSHFLNAKKWVQSMGLPLVVDASESFYEIGDQAA